MSLSFNLYAGVAGGSAATAVAYVIVGHPIVAGLATAVAVSSGLCAIRDAMFETTARAKPQTPCTSPTTRNNKTPAP